MSVECIEWQQNLHDPLPLRQQLKTRSDANALRFILRELITNSIDAHQRKRALNDSHIGYVRVSFIHVKPDLYLIRCHDNGDGIPKNKFVQYLFTQDGSANINVNFTTGGKGDAKIIFFSSRSYLIMSRTSISDAFTVFGRARECAYHTNLQCEALHNPVYVSDVRYPHKICECKTTFEHTDSNWQNWCEDRDELRNIQGTTIEISICPEMIDEYAKIAKITEKNHLQCLTFLAHQIIENSDIKHIEFFVDELPAVPLINLSMLERIPNSHYLPNGYNDDSVRVFLANNASSFIVVLSEFGVFQFRIQMSRCHPKQLIIQCKESRTQLSLGRDQFIGTLRAVLQEHLFKLFEASGRSIFKEPDQMMLIHSEKLALTTNSSILLKYSESRAGHKKMSYLLTEPCITLQDVSDMRSSRMEKILEMPVQLVWLCVTSQMLIMEIKQHAIWNRRYPCKFNSLSFHLFVQRENQKADSFHVLGGHISLTDCCIVRVNPFLNNSSQWKYPLCKTSRAKSLKSLQQLWYLLAHEMAHCLDNEIHTSCSDHDLAWSMNFEFILHEFSKVNLCDFLWSTFQKSIQLCTQDLMARWRNVLRHNYQTAMTGTKRRRPDQRRIKVPMKLNL